VRTKVWLALAIVALVCVSFFAGYVGGALRASQTGNAVVPVDPASPRIVSVAIRRTTLAVTNTVTGTLMHRPAPWPLVGQTAGVVTSEVAVGSVCGDGSRLYSVNDAPVFLVVGSIPLWREITVGDVGPDVGEIKAVFASLTRSRQLTATDSYSAADAGVVHLWQATHGYGEAGGSIPLGEFLAEPTTVLVSGYQSSVGSTVAPGQPVVTVTTTQREVVASVPLDAVSTLKLGTTAQISVGTEQAQAHVTGFAPAAAQQSGADPNSVEVTFAVDGTSTLDPDGTQVEVSYGTQQATNVLAVPIAALLALAEGGYGLQVVGPHGATHLVPVTVGIIDDAQGLAQVSGVDIQSGLQVSVPSI